MNLYLISTKLHEIFILYKAGAITREEYELLKSLIICCNDKQQLDYQNDRNYTEDMSSSSHRIEN